MREFILEKIRHSEAHFDVVEGIAALSVLGIGGEGEPLIRLPKVGAFLMLQGESAGEYKSKPCIGV